MDVTYREVQELKDKLPPLQEKHREERKNADYMYRRYEKEERQWGYGNEDAQGSFRTYQYRSEIVAGLEKGN